MLYNEAKHNILALVGMAKQRVLKSFSFFHVVFCFSNLLKYLFVVILVTTKTIYRKDPMSTISKSLENNCLTCCNNDKPFLVVIVKSII
jgi:hypothetical protein